MRRPEGAAYTALGVEPLRCGVWGEPIAGTIVKWAAGCQFLSKNSLMAEAGMHAAGERGTLSLSRNLGRGSGHESDEVFFGGWVPVDPDPGSGYVAQASLAVPPTTSRLSFNRLWAVVAHFHSILAPDSPRSSSRMMPPTIFSCPMVGSTMHLRFP